MIITSADDSVSKGEMKKLRICGHFLESEIKVPEGGKWKWIKVKKYLPEKLKRALPKAKEIDAPLIKRVFLKSGNPIYRLVIPLKHETVLSKK